MDEKVKANAEELKEETKDAFNQVKSQIKDTDFKAETKEATNFFKEMFMSPINAMKSIASGENAKLGRTIIIMVFLIVLSVASTLVSLFKYSSITSIGSNLWDLLVSVLSPIFVVLVPTLILFLLNKNAKKPLLVILSTMVAAMVPVVLKDALNVVDSIIPQLYNITRFFTGVLSSVHIVLSYFAVKFICEEDEEKSIKLFVVVEFLTTVVLVVLSMIGKY